MENSGWINVSVPSLIPFQQSHFPACRALHDFDFPATAPLLFNLSPHTQSPASWSRKGWWCSWCHRAGCLAEVLPGPAAPSHPWQFMGRAEFSQRCCSLRMSFLTKGLILHYCWGELKLHFAGLVLIKMCTLSFPRERESSAGHTGSCNSVSWTQQPPWHGNHSWCKCVCAHKGFWGFIWFPTVPAPVSLGCHAQVTVGITVGVRLLWALDAPVHGVGKERGEWQKWVSLLNGKLGTLTSLWVISIILVLLCNEQRASQGEQIQE